MSRLWTDGRRPECEDRARILETEFAIMLLMLIILMMLEWKISTKIDSVRTQFLFKRPTHLSFRIRDVGPEFCGSSLSSWNWDHYFTRVLRCRCVPSNPWRKRCETWSCARWLFAYPMEPYLLVQNQDLPLGRKKIQGCLPQVLNILDSFFHIWCKKTTSEM